MRNDVKFGLTIGGTLLALLIVWAILTPHKAPEGGAVVVQPTTMPGAVASANMPATTQPTTITETPPLLGSPLNAEDNVASSTGQDWNRLLQTGDTPVTAENQPTTRPTELASIPTTQPTMAQATRTHKIAAGESFYSIASAVYGDSKYYMRLEDANPNINPNRLRVGMVINVPGLDDALPAKTKLAETTDSIDSSSSYRVKASDTLIVIARKLYGNGQEWEKIYDANRDAIGPNPARLTVGMVLRLPTAPKVALAN